MKLTEMNCPSCGGPLITDSDRERCYCEYCGKIYTIGDHTVNKSDETHTYILKDEARIRESELKAESDRESRKHEITMSRLHREENREAEKRKFSMKRLAVRMLIVSIVVFFIGQLVAHTGFGGKGLADTFWILSILGLFFIPISLVFLLIGVFTDLFSH